MGAFDDDSRSLECTSKAKVNELINIQEQDLLKFYTFVHFTRKGHTRISIIYVDILSIVHLEKILI